MSLYLQFDAYKYVGHPYYFIVSCFIQNYIFTIKLNALLSGLTQCFSIHVYILEYYVRARCDQTWRTSMYTCVHLCMCYCFYIVTVHRIMSHFVLASLFLCGHIYVNQTNSLKLQVSVHKWIFCESVQGWSSPLRASGQLLRIGIEHQFCDCHIN